MPGATSLRNRPKLELRSINPRAHSLPYLALHGTGRSFYNFFLHTWLAKRKSLFQKPENKFSKASTEGTDELQVKPSLNSLNSKFLRRAGSVPES